MAARVGTGVTATSDGDTPTFASPAKSTTTGNMLVVFVKWENAVTPTIDSVTDTAGNTYEEISEFTHSSGVEPAAALFAAYNITGHAANVTTVNFSAAPANLFNRLIVEEFSGIATSSAKDGTVQTNSGTGTSYSTSNIATSTTGLVVLGVGGFTGLSGWSGTPGTPDFTVGETVSDTGFLYLISSSAQTVTPAASATGSDKWVAIAQAFKDAGGGGGGGTTITGLGRRLKGFIYSQG
jgi:hypothetical protein